MLVVSYDDISSVIKDISCLLNVLQKRGKMKGINLNPVLETQTIAWGKLLSLEEIRSEMENCVRCKLHAGRTHLVFGEGNPDARLLFFGEGPGRDEDEQGRPFVGRAGQLLDKIIESMGFSRSDVYICNVVKCRPPNNRNPEEDEIRICKQFALAQIDSVDPEAIVTLGKIASQALLETSTPISKLRGQLQEYNSIPVMPTYHPAYLLRNPSQKREVWEDMKKVMALLGKVPK